MGVRVSVSARILNWPQQCACCLGPTDQRYRATFTRVTGKKVVRTDERGWDVPYCKQCFRHRDAQEHAETITTATARLVLGAGIVLGLALLATGGMFVLIPIGARPPLGIGRTIGFFAAALAVTAIGVAVGGGAVMWFRRLHADAVERRRAALQRAKSLASPRCCTMHIAVAYEGWSGSVHTFWFANQNFADAFVRANAGKVLRS